MSRKSFCRLGSQTLFFRGREATTGNASAVRRLCKVETSANVNNHWETCAMGDDIITNVISTNQHFTSTFLMQIYSNSRDVIASSPFFSRPASRVSQRACLPPKAVIDFKMLLQWSYPGLQHLTEIKCGRKPKSVTSLMCFPANQ